MKLETIVQRFEIRNQAEREQTKQKLTSQTQHIQRNVQVEKILLGETLL